MYIPCWYLYDCILSRYIAHGAWSLAYMPVQGFPGLSRDLDVCPGLSYCCAVVNNPCLLASSWSKKWLSQYQENLRLNGHHATCLPVEGILDMLSAMSAWCMVSCIHSHPGFPWTLQGFGRLSGIESICYCCAVVLTQLIILAYWLVPEVRSGCLNTKRT
jgi:hypothetical protein